MSEEDQEFDLDALAGTIVARLDDLCDKSDADNQGLRVLAARVRDALEVGDKQEQLSLVDEVKEFLESGLEIREAVHNVFQMFFYYVYLRNGDAGAERTG